MQQRVTVAPLIAQAAAVGLMITIEDVTERLDRERSFASIAKPSSADRRTDALASEDWQVRDQAVRHLKQSASVDELRHLLDTLQRDHHDLNVLNSALRVLIAAGRTVVEPLVQLLSDDAANLRMHAALALGELRAHEATPDLVATLDDPDENVRFHAIEALGRIGASESIDPLAKIAASDNFFLAFAAIDALSKTDDARVAPLMVTLLDQELLRPAAIATLAAIGDEDWVPALVGALNRADSEAGTIASALVAIHRRYEDDLGAGSFIVESASDAITATGRERLVGAANRQDADRRPPRAPARLDGTPRRAADGADRRGVAAVVDCGRLSRRSAATRSPLDRAAGVRHRASARIAAADAAGTNRRPPRDRAAAEGARGCGSRRRRGCSRGAWRAGRRGRARWPCWRSSTIRARPCDGRQSPR